VRFGILVAALCLAVLPPSTAAQQKDQPGAPKEQMFSGEVTAMDSASLTATRTGSKDSKTFLVTPDTKVEGALKLKSRVTIRYVVAENGARALRIIVRPVAKK